MCILQIQTNRDTHTSKHAIEHPKFEVPIGTRFHLAANPKFRFDSASVALRPDQHTVQ